ncbi:hypothetical protein QQS21_008733 [Conoideocrella luteorostrata]|uniref:Cutinase n=1 Tax=Conoideocrella luteorostrata TaxID=1105319 RepID=A0AAJ0CIA0_9HYPO|nr:hypothetical protein QQS21_008733 [Conoideocrella luteorostrata]
MKTSIASRTLLLAMACWHITCATATCYDYVLINSRGTGEPQGESIGFRGMIEQVMSALPNGVRFDTKYLAFPDATQLTTVKGAKDLAEVIRGGVRDCPEQKYALMGYSQGATVSNLVLQALDPTSKEGQSIKAVVQVGNPYHSPYKEGNKDDKCGISTAGANGILNGIAHYAIPDSWYETGKIRDICYTNDQVCNGVSLGDLFSPTHLGYGFNPSVQSCGAHFLLDKLS